MEHPRTSQRGFTIPVTVVGECQSDKTVTTMIAEGIVSVVFSSPEAALVPGLWRRSFTSGKFHDNLMTIVVDEEYYPMVCMLFY